MPLTISDEVLKQAGLTEANALVEIACRLFDAGKLSLPRAATFAGLSRAQMEEELRSRKIAVYRPTMEDVQEDLRTLDAMREPGQSRFIIN